MFHAGKLQISRGYQIAIGGLALLSLTGLVVTAWLLSDFRHEQEIVVRIIHHLPTSDVAAARELAGDLRLQARLSVLLIVNVIATAAAVTLLVRAYLSSEHSLHEVKVLATDVLASMDQGVITTDDAGVVTSINPRGREILDRRSNGIGFALSEVSEEHSLLDNICRHVLKHHDCLRDRDYELTENGHARTLRAGCSLLRDSSQRHLGTVIHVRDVTEKALMEQRLRRMERYMGLGSLAAGLQHEIKNPLSALSLHVQLLCEALSEQTTSSEIHEMLGIINTEVGRIARVLERFRDYASISELRRSPTDLSPLIQNLARLIEPQANQQQIRLTVELPPNPLPHAFIDTVRFEQLLLNLALNAIEAMPHGGELTLRLRGSEDEIQVDVADTGTGIPDDLRERIFDPYFTTRRTGTGMGLALCEKIVRQHGGTIDYSINSSGTVFTVSLPLDD